MVCRAKSWIYFVFLALSFATFSFAQDEVLTNTEIINLTKAGLDKVVIIAKINSSKTSFDVTIDGLIQLKQAGVADEVVAAMVNPKVQVTAPETPQKPTRLRDELTTTFNRLKNTVVTVFTENGTGTGFIVDGSGLIVTNQHVVGPSEYIAVQFDPQRKVRAVLLTADPEKDVAVLWANLTSFPDVGVAPIAQFDGAEPAVTEGERVFTIGSPLHQSKIITTGIVSKVEERALISDVNVNHGNSGGPLFNSVGEVVGITTFIDPGDPNGPGISGIVRMELAIPVIEKAKAAMKDVTQPTARLLPVDPTDSFPLDAIKDVAKVKKFDFDRYFVGVGDFSVGLLTPPLGYRYAAEAEIAAAKEREKRTKKKSATSAVVTPFDNLHGWAEYTGKYRPILMIRATPEYGESFWGAFGRGLAANYGIHTQAKFRFKTDFYKMRLLCGDKEIEPITPGKIAYRINTSNYFVRMNDASYEGLYTYPADAISSQCGRVTLELYSEKEPDKAKTKVLDPKTVLKIEEDFRPYLSGRRMP